jgi:hypothetical protein
MLKSHQSLVDDASPSRNAARASLIQYETSIFAARCAMAESSALGRERLAISRQILASVRPSDIPGRFWPR